MQDDFSVSIDGCIIPSKPNAISLPPAFVLRVHVLRRRVEVPCLVSISETKRNMGMCGNITRSYNSDTFLLSSKTKSGEKHMRIATIAAIASNKKIVVVMTLIRWCYIS